MKRISVFIFAVVLTLFVTGCFGGKCANCGASMSRDDRMYDPIAGEYVCWDCYFDNAWELLDQFMYVDMIEDYLDARGYAMVKK